MRRWLSILLTAILLAAAMAPALSFAEAKPKVIRMGAIGNEYGKPFTNTVMGVLYAQGLLEEEFKKEGIDVEWYFFKGTGPAINESFANDGIDFAFCGDLASIIGKASGLKTKVIVNGNRGNNIYIAVPADDTKTRSIADLKGKKVGVYKGTYMHLFFNRLLAKNGMSEKDFKMYNLTKGDGYAALAAKEIDAYISIPDIMNLQTQGIARVIYSSKEEPEDFKGTTVLVVTESFARRYPDVVRRVVRSFLKADAWASDEKNRDEFLQISAKTGTPYAVYKKDYEGTSMKQRNCPLLDDFYFTYFRAAIAFAKERGFIRKAFDLDAWTDKSYLEEALKELGLQDAWKD